jgi:hypothetical protein
MNMSQADSKERPAHVSAESVLPIMLNGKASAAAPKLSDNDDNVEMKNMLSSGPDAQLDEDIMQLARLGNIPAIQKLFEAEKFHPTYCDTEGITPLHVCPPVWCGIDLNAELPPSGLQSTTNMPCASSSSRQAPM